MLNLDTTSCPPNAVQDQSSTVYPTSAITCGCPFTGILFPVSDAQGSLLQFTSTFLGPLNTQSPSPVNNSEPEVTTRFLAFEPPMEQTRNAISAYAFDVCSPPLPARNATSAYASNNQNIGGEEIHEDSDEIDALLYSAELEYIDNEEECSTENSPLDMEEEGIASSDHPAKRRRLDSTETEDILMDTASSAMLPSIGHIKEDDRIDLNLIGYIGKGAREKPGGRGRNWRNKREKIQATVSVLRRIIPGSNGKDTASVLAEAVQYLNLLKVRAAAVGDTSSIL